MLSYPPNTPTLSLNRMALRDGAKREWWQYLHENEPGYTRDGRTYETFSYTVALPERDRDVVVVLRADYVPGWVLATAWQLGGQEAFQEFQDKYGWH